MTDLILWKNQEMNKLRRDIDCLFDRFCTGFGIPLSHISAGEPFKINFSETEDAVILTAEIPGVNREDMKIAATESTLTITGATTCETVEAGERYRRDESEAQTFSRTISLPYNVKVDKIEAAYKEDVLKIILPKCESDENRDRSIEIK